MEMITKFAGSINKLITFDARIWKVKFILPIKKSKISTIKDEKKID